jgi:hypothetical protein
LAAALSLWNRRVMVSGCGGVLILPAERQGVILVGVPELARSASSISVGMD